MSGALAGTEICVFDAYGTLFDFNSAVARHRAAVGPKADALSEMWRSKPIHYTWFPNGMGSYAKFWPATGGALDPFPPAHRIAHPRKSRQPLSAHPPPEPFSPVPPPRHT